MAERKKRIRDHKAENARRNELAKQRQFTSRAAERRAKERGDYAKAGFSSHAEYVEARKEAAQRSATYSKTRVSEFSPSMSADKFKLYKSAFGYRTFSNRDAFVRDLADWLHAQDPNQYPPYEGNEDYWNEY